MTTFVQFGLACQHWAGKGLYGGHKLVSFLESHSRRCLSVHENFKKSETKICFLIISLNMAVKKCTNSCNVFTITIITIIDTRTSPQPSPNSQDNSQNYGQAATEQLVDVLAFIV